MHCLLQVFWTQTWPTWFLNGWWCCQRGLRVHLHLRSLWTAPEDHWQCRMVMNYRWQSERPFHPQTKATRGWRDTRGIDCCEHKHKKEETSVRNIAHNYSRLTLTDFFQKYSSNYVWNLGKTIRVLPLQTHWYWMSNIRFGINSSVCRFKKRRNMPIQKCNKQRLLAYVHVAEG